MKVRCGNHGRGIKVYHETTQDVKACYATHFSSPKRQEDARMDDLPSWMTDEDPTYVRPTPSGGRTVRGWWDLPIAAGMWRADARAIER